MEVNIKRIFCLSFYFKNHISNIDLICISHIHNDHIGGIIDVINNVKFESVVIGTKIYSCEEYEELVKQCAVKNIPIKEFTRGKTITLEKNLTLTAIHPSPTPMGNTEDDINNNSLVIILKYKDFEVLLTGDIEKEAEQEIIKETFERDIDILKVCHHGSNTSSCGNFIDYFSPEIAVIQVGKNVFGHPHENTLNTLNKRKIKIYRNDNNGAVIIESDGDSIEVQTMIQ